MMAADRFKLSRCAALVLFFVMGIPSAGLSSTLEDSTKEFARKISAAMPAGPDVSCEIRNISSLPSGDVARIEQALKTALQEQGIHLTSSGAEIALVVTLSENFKKLIWTGEIHKGETSQIVLISVDRSLENRDASSATPVTLRAEKFWEGQERILDAGVISDGHGKSWLVLLRPDSVVIQDTQTDSVGKVEIKPGGTTLREPAGILWYGAVGTSFWFSVAMPPAHRVCEVDLETRSLMQCLPEEDPAGGVTIGRHPMMIVAAPAGPPPPGKGIEVAISPVCGNAAQFLATGGRDDTETDSVQVFQAESSGPVPVSTELDFSGPIIALKTSLDAPARAIVRNLTTGNYEAYRLATSCAQ